MAAALATAPTAVACDAPHHLDVVTLNAWGLPAPLAPHRRSRLRAIARWLDHVDPDVVALQEVWRGAVPHLPVPLARADEPGDDGLGIVDNPDVRVLGALRFSRARGFDALKRKGALAVEVTTDAVPVTVVVTHLQAGRGKANGAVRAAQVDQLIAWAAELPGPLVLLGDLNLVDGDVHDQAAADALAAAGLVDIGPDAGGTYRDSADRYDRILLRDGPRWRWAPASVEVVRYDDDPGSEAPAMFSDHLPVHAHLALVDPG